MGHYPVIILISLHSTLVLNTQHKMLGITTDLNVSEQTSFNQSVFRGASPQSSLSIIKFGYSTLALYIIYKYRTENLKTLSLTMLSSERDLTHVTHVTLSILTVFNNRWGGGGWWPIFYQIYHSNSCQLTLLFSPSPTVLMIMNITQYSIMLKEIGTHGNIFLTKEDFFMFVIII